MKHAEFSRRLVDKFIYCTYKGRHNSVLSPETNLNFEKNGLIGKKTIPGTSENSYFSMYIIYFILFGCQTNIGH